MLGEKGGRLMFHSYAGREGRISQYSVAGYKSPLSRPVVQWRDLWPILRYQDRQIDTNSVTSTSPTQMEMSQLPLATGRRGWCEMLTVTNVCCYGNNCCRCLSKVTLLASVDTPRHKKNIKTGRPQAACNKFIRTSWSVCFSDQICQHSELYDFPRWRAWTGLDSIWQF